MISDLSDVKNLLVGAIGAVIGSLLGAIIAVVGAYFFTRKIEREKLLTQKKEEVLILIFSVLTSRANARNFYHGNLTVYEDSYTPEKFEHDLKNIELKLLHAAALIKAYIGNKLKEFNEGYALIMGKEGFFQQRLAFVKAIRTAGENVMKPGLNEYSRDHRQDYHNQHKEMEYKKFLEILNKAESALWESSYKLIDMLQE